MGRLTLSLNVTLDGCVDHQEGIADDETHDFFTRLMNESGAMLWGRVTYEMMESSWPAVARGEVDVPPAMRDFSRSMLVRGTDDAGYFYSLPTAVLFLVAAVVITWFILYRTMLGRSIFAVGGSREAAARIGFNVRATQVFVYGYVGVLAGVAGLIHASLARVANPSDIVGLELEVIAAVVLGGARLTGGYGTITGTLLGVTLIVLVNNTLVTLGIPTTWQKVMIGFLILLGTGLPAFQARLRANRMG